MSVLRGMASVLAGVGTGLVANKEDAEKKARQDKEDAWRDEQREYQRAEIARANADRQGMRDAGAERTTMTGTVTQAGGNKYLNADPVQATKMQEMLAAEAEMTGGHAPTQQAGTGITGTMARGHQITTEPVDLKAVNGAEARAGRFQAELERQGKPLDAMNISNALMENKAKSLGLEAAQLKAADDKFNRDVLSRLDAEPDWTQGAAKLLTETQLGGLAGLKVAPVVSADGKTVSFVGTAADGTSKPLAPPMPNTPDGRLAFTQQLLKASPEMKISWLVERGKAEQAAAKLALDERRVATTEKRNDAMAYKLMGGGGGGSSGGGRGGQGESGSTGLPDPMGGFDPKKAYAVATEQAVAELAQGRTPATPEAISRRATAIYRALEGEFKASGQELAIGQAINSMAQMAQTPQQLQVVAQRALAAGYSIEQLAAVNPRFAALAKAKDAGANDGKSTQNPDGKRQDKPASPGVFTDKNGQIQLLQPLMNLSAWRKKMVEEANAEQAARGY